jgi:hypothetical protein
VERLFRLLLGFHSSNPSSAISFNSSRGACATNSRPWGRVRPPLPDAVDPVYPDDNAPQKRYPWIARRSLGGRASKRAAPLERPSHPTLACDAIRRLSPSRLRNDSCRAPLNGGVCPSLLPHGPTSPHFVLPTLGPASAGLFFPPLKPLPSPSACPRVLHYRTVFRVVRAYSRHRCIIEHLEN